MRILILNWRDIKNPSSGGAEILTQEIATRWVAWGHEVTQFSSSFPGCLKNEKIRGVEIVREGHPDVRHLFNSVHFLAFQYYKKRYEDKFDVVIDEIHGIPFFTPWYVREKKVVLICEVAGELWQKMLGPVFGLIGKTIEMFYLKVLYKNITFLTISQSTKKDLLAHGVNPKDITVLPMGISLPSNIPTVKKEKNPTLLFVGRIIPPKGVEDALIAFEELTKRLPAAILWIAGRGEEQYMKYLKDKSKELGIDNKVIFFGFISEGEKFELMSKAHVLIQPSIREGFGLTIPEAGFVHTPTIAYNSPGIRDVIKNGINGILLTTNSPEFLAAQIYNVLSNKLLYKKLVKGARFEAEKYNWDNTAKIAFALLRKDG